MTAMPIADVLIGFTVVVVIYFVCELVTPDFDGRDTYDLRDFQARQGRTYMTAFLLLVLQSLTVNIAAGRPQTLRNGGEKTSWYSLCCSSPPFRSLSISLGCRSRPRFSSL